MAVVEVGVAVEVVEAAQRGESTVVVEGVSSTDNEIGSRDGGGRDAGRESRKSDNESGSEFSEHDDDLKWLNGIKIEVCYKHECKAYPGGIERSEQRL